MIAFTYHKDYNKYDLGVENPLIGDKPQKTYDFFQKNHLFENMDILTPTKASENDLRRVHHIDYINQVKTLSKVGGMLALDTPAPIGIYEYARLATGGTILCGKKLFDNYHISINPLGGFHHASRQFSSGFCFFNDIAVVVEWLRHHYKLKRFLIVDLDVHHANGTQEIYFTDPSVLSVSIHQDGRTLYPGTGSSEKIGREQGKGFTINIPLPPGTDGMSYRYAFDSIIPTVCTQFDPEIIIYQSGVDAHHLDPLADLNMCTQDFYYLAHKMEQLSKITCKRLLVLFGGGYNSIASIHSYYNISCGLLGKKEYLHEKCDFPSKKIAVEEIIEQVKSHLQEFWDF